MLVDAINHGADGRATETTVLGPFYVGDPPEHPLGADLAGGGAGEPLLVRGTVVGPDGSPLPGAVVDTWQADEDGYYDVQRGDELELRARLRTDAAGRFWFWAVVPASYPIPVDGPVGDMLRAQGRHPYRPAHVHFRIAAPGCRELITHVFLAGDDYLGSDVVFGVKRSLIAAVEQVEAGELPDGTPVTSPHARLTYDFALAREDAPRAAGRRAHRGGREGPAHEPAGAARRRARGAGRRRDRRGAPGAAVRARPARARRRSRPRRPRRAGERAGRTRQRARHAVQLVAGPDRRSRRGRSPRRAGCGSRSRTASARSRRRSPRARC